MTIIDVRTVQLVPTMGELTIGTIEINDADDIPDTVFHLSHSLWQA